MSLISSAICWALYALVASRRWPVQEALVTESCRGDETAFASKVLTRHPPKRVTVRCLLASKAIAFKYCMSLAKDYSKDSLPCLLYGMLGGLSKNGEPNLKAKDCNAMLSVIGLSYAELLPTKLY